MEIKQLYKKLSVNELIQLDPFKLSEIICQRYFIKFSKQFLKDYPNFRIKPTPDKTIFDAYGKNGDNRKYYLEFKVRDKIYEDGMMIEPKNVKLAIEAKCKGIEYLYINFIDDFKTKQRHMLIWSSYHTDFTKLPSIRKEIRKTEVTDTQYQNQQRFILSIKESRHYVTGITEILPEAQTQEYIQAYFNKK